ncbi:hypothetical protein VM1G_11385 [Cytospora mali]|uniref:Uncharacterized protein n=1 Tax=Cytospora mali TaxID=578113 RepID=A0A194VR96_CYTMA|nr:hypothetical protein VM1G_11385 [Valsa mali]
MLPVTSRGAQLGGPPSREVYPRAPIPHTTFNGHGTSFQVSQTPQTVMVRVRVVANAETRQAQKPHGVETRFPLKTNGKTASAVDVPPMVTQVVSEILSQYSGSQIRAIAVRGLEPAHFPSGGEGEGRVGKMPARYSKGVKIDAGRVTSRGAGVGY